MRRALCLAASWLVATAAGAEARQHEVKPGESLASIASHEMGDPRLWPVLYRANRDRIKDPERIYPGQRISIPPPGAEPGEAPPATAAGDAE